MSALLKTQPFPNLFLKRPDGTSLELVDLRKKQHALLLFLSRNDSDAMAFVSHFQDQARLFEWLNTRLLVVFRNPKDIATPWPAPGHPPCLIPDMPLPAGVEWDKAYVVSKNGTLLEIYEEPALVSVAKVERDFLYWEAGHCLP
ncbi:MAG TPA: hypothetical protein VK914_09420 [bacterium]|jgi:hypothetical protein|nr:hypothetical protein [bacterium]